MEWVDQKSLLVVQLCIHLFLEIMKTLQGDAPDGGRGIGTGKKDMEKEENWQDLS